MFQWFLPLLSLSLLGANALEPGLFVDQRGHLTRTDKELLRLTKRVGEESGANDLLFLSKRDQQTDHSNHHHVKEGSGSKDTGGKEHHMKEGSGSKDTGDKKHHVEMLPVSNKNNVHQSSDSKHHHAQDKDDLKQKKKPAPLKKKSKKKKKKKKKKNNQKVGYQHLWLDKVKVKDFDLQSSGRCSRTTTDQCGVVCHCIKGRQYCCRQRRDWDELTTKEKRRYISTVHDLAMGRLGLGLRNQYNALLRVHERFWRTAIHDREEFFPWHRAYLLEFENILQQVDCRLTVPYWDWTKHPGQWWHHNVFQWAGHSTYPGGGLSTRLQCPSSGYFTANSGFRDLHGQCLRRQFSYRFSTPSYTRIQNILRSPFNQFEEDLRYEHGVPHYVCGGENGGLFFTDRAAEDPLFFLHHSNVEYHFYQRQVRVLGKKWREYWGRMPRRLLTGLAGYRMEDALNPFSIGRDNLCVEYVETKDQRYEQYLQHTGHARSHGELEQCTADLSAFPGQVFTLFGVNAAGRARFLEGRRNTCY